MRPWIHPITQAKVNIFGSVKDALKHMEKEGLTPEQLPVWCGGTNPGIKVSDILEDYIAKAAGIEEAAGVEEAAAAVGALEVEDE